MPVVKALLRAWHRGAELTLLADYKDNSVDRSGKARAALGALVNAS
ncbi:MAG: hypothetical protein ACJ8GJ_16495 [Vitreoscilla sp.]